MDSPQLKELDPAQHAIAHLLMRTQNRYNLPKEILASYIYFLVTTDFPGLDETEKLLRKLDKDWNSITRDGVIPWTTDNTSKR